MGIETGGGPTPKELEKYQEEANKFNKLVDKGIVSTQEVSDQEIVSEETKPEEILADKIENLLDFRQKLTSEGTEELRDKARRMKLQHPADFARKIIGWVQETETGVVAPKEKAESETEEISPKIGFRERLRGFFRKRSEEKEPPTTKEQKAVLEKLERLAYHCAQLGFSQEYIDLQDFGVLGEKQERKLVQKLIKSGKISTAADIAVRRNLNVKGFRPDLQSIIDQRDTEAVNQYFFQQKKEKMSKEYDEERGGLQSLFAVRFMSGYEFSQIMREGRFTSRECVVSHWLSFQKTIERAHRTLSSEANDWTNYSNAGAAYLEREAINLLYSTYRAKRQEGQDPSEAKKRAVGAVVEKAQNEVRKRNYPGSLSRHSIYHIPRQDLNFFENALENPSELLDSKSLRRFIRLSTYTTVGELPYEFAVFVDPEFTVAHSHSYSREEDEIGIRMNVFTPGMRWKRLDSSRNFRDAIWAVIPMTPNRDLLEEAVRYSDDLGEGYIGARYAVFTSEGKPQNSE